MTTAKDAAAAAPESSADGDNTRAIAGMTMGMAAFVVSDALVKIALAEVPVGQAIALRGVFGTVLVGAIAGYLGQLRWHRALLSGPMLARLAGEVGSSVFFFQALQSMTLGDATAVLQALPLVLTAVSALVLRERVGWRRWTATALGLVGVLLILKPGPGSFEPASLYACLAVACIAVRDLSTRGIPVAIPSLLVTTSTAISVMLAGFALSLVGEWRPVSHVNLTWLALAGVIIVGGHFTVVYALRTGDISVVILFRYAAVVFALIAGYVVWRQLPDAASLAGTVIVVAAGLYTFHRERVRQWERVA